MSVLLCARTFICLHGYACAKGLPDGLSGREGRSKWAFAGSPFSSDSVIIK